MDYKKWAPVAEGGLAATVLAASPLQDRPGSVVLRGAEKGIRLYVDSWEGTLPPELNQLSVEVIRVHSIEGQSPPQWARDFFFAVAGQLTVRYGNVHLAEEFAAKNLIDDSEGVRAVGVNLTEGLPGLYWLNCFGPPFVDLIGRERLLAAPAAEALATDGSVLLALSDSPTAWRTDEYKATEQAVLQHLGEEFFFQRQDPGRLLKRPAFASRR